MATMQSEQSRFLLLLPADLSLSSIQSNYGETVTKVLKEVASQSAESQRGPILEIALACPHLVDSEQTPRAQLFAQTESLVSAVYRLVCVVAARDKIDVEDYQGVDVRVLLVAWSPVKPDRLGSGPYGPIVTLQALAQSRRQWKNVFSEESDAGRTLFKAFDTAKDETGNVQQNKEGQQSSIKVGSARRHYHTAVGGTFDHLHIGHKLLLTMTVFAIDNEESTSPKSMSRSATIGITGDKLLTKKQHAELLESWRDRQCSVQRFVDSLVNFTQDPPKVTHRDERGPNGKSVDLHYPSGLTVKCTEIQDPFGPTITEEQISALIISAETRSGGAAVNDKRREKGWKELEVFEIGVLQADEKEAAGDGFEGKISSTAIRAKLARPTKPALQ
ncbi:pantetheine-phosphate adenylyltransferase family protein-like protein [Piedraia hortae CBS 480.64]|uniref:Pantetheine-phosphate adenylyltransferase family protein-like protein n=1 Tax=Piedraia hortae CBS 480.64 TaxID=1314780 RepID=A0A6A7BRP0_9PEZI|nr:pantetheine-phosphate adenylyltransferase family protein-like protein [Piedraia hortae CBS 480.64]